MYSEGGCSLMGGGFFGFPAGILFIIIVIALLFYLMNKKSSDSGNSALDTLKKRYANGEITKEEFEQMRKDIS